MTTTKQQKTTQKPAESPKTGERVEAKGMAPVEAKAVEGEHLARIREDMDPSRVKFKQLDSNGNETGKVITLNHLFKDWARHEDTGRSLSYTLGSFALAVAETNPDLSADAQSLIFRSLANKAADKAFPKELATDEFGHPLYDGDQPVLLSTVPDSYKTMLSGIVTLWTGKGKKGNKVKTLHPPIIPGNPYKVYDGRTGEWKDVIVHTLGHMRAVKRGFEREIAERKEKDALKANQLEAAKLIALAESEGFTDDEMTGTCAKVKEWADNPRPGNSLVLSADVKKANDELDALITKRRTQRAEKEGKATSDEQATPSEVEAGKDVEPKTDSETGETVAVNKETGTTPIEALGLDRHVRPEEAYKLKYLATLFSALEGKPRDQLMEALNVLINTCLKANPEIARKVKAAVQARKAA